MYILCSYNIYIYINTTCLHVHLNFKPLTWQYGLPKDSPNGCCRYAMSQKNNMSTVDNQSIPILKMCEWVQLATNKHPDLVVLCIKSTSDTSRSSKNRTSQKSENSISIYHPQKQLNRVPVPHVPRSKEISHIRDLCICLWLIFGCWMTNVRVFCRIWSHIVATCFNSVGPSHGHGPATLPRSLDTFGGHVATPYGSMSIHLNHIYISTIFGSFWRVNVGKYALIKLAVHWGESIHWCFRGAPWILSWKSMAFVVRNPHRCWLNIPI